MKKGRTIRAAALVASLMLITTSGVAHAGLVLKGGATRFTSDLGKVTATGPAWGVLYSFKPASFVAVETGSEGSRNDINDPADPGSTGLLRLGETTMVHFVLPVLPVVHPFVGAGISVDYIMVQGGQFGISVPGISGQSDARYNSGIFVHFPFTAGIEFDFSAVALGVRATYHRSAVSPFSKGINPNFVDLSATLGVTF